MSRPDSHTRPTSPEDRRKADRRAEHDDPTRRTDRQIDDNQDDMGRDVNDPSNVANDINRDPARHGGK